MFYEDRISVATPEGVTLEATLAGVGSRLAAAVVDFLLRGAVLVALLILLYNLGGSGDRADRSGTSAGVAIAFLLVFIFLVWFAYDVLFETLASGRTPGKRWAGLRVVKVGGAPVGFLASSVRNILRIIDALPGFYLVGILAVLFTKRNQRLGDLAAGTLVVRDRKQVTSLPQATPAVATADVGLYDVSAVSGEEMATVRRFLDRRATLTPEARDRLAMEMATRLGPKVVGPPKHWDPEDFLEYLVATKAARE